MWKSELGRCGRVSWVGVEESELGQCGGEGGESVWRSGR